MTPDHSWCPNAGGDTGDASTVRRVPVVAALLRLSTVASHTSSVSVVGLRRTDWDRGREGPSGMRFATAPAVSVLAAIVLGACAGSSPTEPAGVPDPTATTTYGDPTRLPTPDPIPTSVPEPTSLPTSPSPTATPIPTRTPAPSPTPTSVPTSTPTATPTPTPQPTPTMTPTPVPTIVPDPVQIVLYVPGIESPGLADLFAVDQVFEAGVRARASFPTALFVAFEEAGFEPAWFSYHSSGRYEGESARYTASDTRQSLRVSARALDEQVFDLLTTERVENPGAPDPEIVIVSHSLGGAVAARWAASAQADTLDAVKTIFTFDSPVAGIDGLRGLFGGNASVDLQDPAEIARFEHGSARADFAQVGNEFDAIVPEFFSFTHDPWRTLVTSCTESAISTGHDCSKRRAVETGFVEETLASVPPIWSGATARPGPLPRVLQLTDLAWVDVSDAEITTVERGTVVTLRANSPDMDGLSVFVQIQEIDLFFSERVAVGRMTFSGSTGAAAWTASWVEDDLDGPEFVFSVLGFDSPELKVN